MSPYCLTSSENLHLIRIKTRSSVTLHFLNSPVSTGVHFLTGNHPSTLPYSRALMQNLPSVYFHQSYTPAIFQISVEMIQTQRNIHCSSYLNQLALLILWLSIFYLCHFLNTPLCSAHFLGCSQHEHIEIESTVTREYINIICIHVVWLNIAKKD